MTEKNFEEQLMDKVNKLAGEIQPERDLWPGIDLAIEKMEQRHLTPQRWMGIAASLAVVGIAAWLFHTPQTTQEAVNLYSVVSAMSADHDEKISVMLTKYEEQPAYADNWQDQLAELDNAARSIKAAMKEDPDNVDLLNMLKAVYQQQIKLIETVHQPEWL